MHRKGTELWFLVILLVMCSIGHAQPARQVSGVVTDAETGEPIESFWVIRGNSFKGRERFQYHEAMDYRNGEYDYLIDANTSHQVIRIEADGYLPVVSPILDSRDDSTFDAQLRRGINIIGRVVTHQGEPAADADVMMLSECMTVWLLNQRPTEELLCPLAITDDQGRFSLRPFQGKFDLVVVHETGRARITSEQSQADGPIQLEPWARVEGVLMLGSKPGKGQAITMSWSGTRNNWETREIWDYRTRTDENGRFDFDRVHVGEIQVGRVIEVGAWRDHPLTGVTNRKLIKTEPGKTATVQVGGVGQAVVGRIRIPQDLPDSYILSQPLLRPPPQRRREAHEAGTWDELLQNSYIVPVEPDGSFRIEDVLPGEYVLSVDFRVFEERVPMLGFGGKLVARVALPVTVPEIPSGRSDDPLDLGEIEVELLEPR